MLQTITDKCADYLFPLLIGVGIWYAVHYAVLTPRILKVELPKAVHEIEYTFHVPPDITQCLLDNIVEETLSTSRLESALYTASFEHIARPYNRALLDVGKQLDMRCGVNQARTEALARQQRQAEIEKARRQRETALALLEQKQQLEEEAIRRARELKEKLEEETRDRAMAVGFGILGLIFGGSQ